MQRYKLKGMLFFAVIAVCLSLTAAAGEEVYLGGFPFGIKMTTDGVYVSGICDVESTVGKVCPAKDAGIKEGDVIISINGDETDEVGDVAEHVSDSQGKMLKTQLKRGNKTVTVNLIPVKTADSGEYKTGLFIKDCASGIGTVTFVTEDGSTFGGLGHGITDRNTAGLLPLGKGTVHNVEITDVTKGTKDCPGELKGSLVPRVAGEIEKNTEMGVFGKFDRKPRGLEKIEIASHDEIKTGECTLHTCLGGHGSSELKGEIVEIVDKNSKTKNFIVALTDKDALAKTGGIVQGMSGSPIIQDGKLVGAVTHVFVNDPTRGYGIFIENMLAEAEKIK